MRNYTGRTIAEIRSGPLDYSGQLVRLENVYARGITLIGNVGYTLFLIEKDTGRALMAYLDIMRDPYTGWLTDAMCVLTASSPNTPITVEGGIGSEVTGVIYLHSAELDGYKFRFLDL